MKQAYTDGRLLMVNLTPANTSDSAGAQTILNAIRKRWPWIKHLFAGAQWRAPPSQRSGLLRLRSGRENEDRSSERVLHTTPVTTAVGPSRLNFESIRESTCCFSE